MESGDTLVEKEKEFDILKHSLVPLHTIISSEEKEELLQKYKITPNQLPKIFSNDVVVKAIAAKPGDILKIIRKSPTAEKTTYYRLVIKPEAE